MSIFLEEPCAICDYDRRGSAGLRCPECGFTPPEGGFALPARPASALTLIDLLAIPVAFVLWLCTLPLLLLIPQRENVLDVLALIAYILLLVPLYLGVRRMAIRYLPLQPRMPLLLVGSSSGYAVCRRSEPEEGRLKSWTSVAEEEIKRVRCKARPRNRALLRFWFERLEVRIDTNRAPAVADQITHWMEAACNERGELTDLIAFVKAPVATLPPRCVQCRYDLRGSQESQRCPECGFDYAQPILFASAQEPPSSQIMGMVIFAGVFVIASMVFAFVAEARQPACICSAALGLVLLFESVVAARLRSGNFFPIMLLIADDGLRARSLLGLDQTWQRWRWRTLKGCQIVTTSRRVYLRIDLHVPGVRRARSELNYALAATKDEARRFADIIERKIRS